MKRRPAGLAILCATAWLALPATGSARVELLKPAKADPGHLTFRLKGVGAESVLRASLVFGRAERRLALRAVRAAARRGALRVKRGDGAVPRLKLVLRPRRSAEPAVGGSPFVAEPQPREPPLAVASAEQPADPTEPQPLPPRAPSAAPPESALPAEPLVDDSPFVDEPPLQEPAPPAVLPAEPVPPPQPAPAAAPEPASEPESESESSGEPIVADSPFVVEPTLQEPLPPPDPPADAPTEPPAEPAPQPPPASPPPPPEPEVPAAPPPTEPAPAVEPPPAEPAPPEPQPAVPPPAPEEPPAGEQPPVAAEPPPAEALPEPPPPLEEPPPADPPPGEPPPIDEPAPGEPPAASPPPPGPDPEPEPAPAPEPEPELIAEPIVGDSPFVDEPPLLEPVPVIPPAEEPTDPEPPVEPVPDQPPQTEPPPAEAPPAPEEPPPVPEDPPLPEPPPVDPPTDEPPAVEDPAPEEPPPPAPPPEEPPPAAEPPAEEQPPPPTPALEQPAPGELLTSFADSFTGEDGILTNHYAYWSPDDPMALRSDDWEMESGCAYRREDSLWTGLPSAVIPDRECSNGSGSEVFRLWTKQALFADVSVTLSLRNNGYVPGAEGERSWDGVKVWLRRQGRSGPVGLYLVEVHRRQGNILIQKKCPGSGDYIILAQSRPEGADAPIGEWETVGGTIRNLDDGGVHLSLVRHGQTVLEATDAGEGCAPLTDAGRIGIRGDNTDFNVDGLIVEPLP